MTQYKIDVDLMGEPEEIEVTREHAIFRYVVWVQLSDQVSGKALATNSESLLIGWRRGDEKPHLVKMESDAAASLLASDEVLSDLKESVAYARDCLQAMN